MNNDGSILIFLPGKGEINSLSQSLIKSNVSNQIQVIPCHSTLTSMEQSFIFNKPKNGITKIVLATNIAETSLTIPDCVIVIDTGRLKEIKYDNSIEMSSLVEVWVSKAASNQVFLIYLFIYRDLADLEELEMVIVIDYIQNIITNHLIPIKVQKSCEFH